MIRRLPIPLLAIALVAAACSSSARLESGALNNTEDTDHTYNADNTADDVTESQTTAGDHGTASDPEPVTTLDPDENDPNEDPPEDSGSEDGAEPDESDSDAGQDPDSDAESDHDETASGLTGPGSASAASGETLTPVAAGDSGDEVLALQNRLAELGFAPGSPDGSYGKRTTIAVTAFQDLVDLPTTGDANTQTINALVTYRYDGLVLKAGDTGPDVETLQLRLLDGPFDPGPSDGEYGTGTVQAVWALEKLAGIPVDGSWGPLDEKAWEELVTGSLGEPEKSHDMRWVEVDLSTQLMKVYDPDSKTPTLVSHASSGSGVPWSNDDHSGSSITPLGDFHINRRINGWRESSLNIGRLYNPLYFNGGIAFHGATSVPLYPASHGCIRLPMHIADYLPSELPNGTPVHILS